MIDGLLYTIAGMETPPSERIICDRQLCQKSNKFTKGADRHTINCCLISPSTDL